MRHQISLGILPCTNQFSRNPRHQKVRETFNLLGGQRAIRRNLLPLEETPSAAAGTGMLSPKNRMSAPRRLPAVVGGIGRCERRTRSASKDAPALSDRAIETSADIRHISLRANRQIDLSDTFRLCAHPLHFSDSRIMVQCAPLELQSQCLLLRSSEAFR